MDTKLVSGKKLHMDTKLVSGKKLHMDTEMCNWEKYPLAQGCATGKISNWHKGREKISLI